MRRLIPLVLLLAQQAFAAVPAPPTTAYTRGFLVTTNQATAQAYLGTGGTGNTTNTYNTIITTNLTVQNNLTVSNLYTVNGNHNTMIITNYVQMPWTTLTMSGSNVSTINLAAGSMFKLTLTNNAFINVPSNLPGTSLAQTIQIHVAQDGTGARTLMLTNSGWVLSGSGTSTNAIPAITTNANAVSVLTFSTSPFSSTLLYGVLATTP